MLFKDNRGGNYMHFYSRRYSRNHNTKPVKKCPWCISYNMGRNHFFLTYQHHSDLLAILAKIWVMCRLDIDFFHSVIQVIIKNAEDYQAAGFPWVWEPLFEYMFRPGEGQSSPYYGSQSHGSYLWNVLLK